MRVDRPFPAGDSLAQELAARPAALIARACPAPPASMLGPCGGHRHPGSAPIPPHAERMSHHQTLLDYLQHYAARDLPRTSALLADDVTLRDWAVSVRGKAAVVAETAKNFAGAQDLAIEVLHAIEQGDTVAAELRIVVDGTIELQVVDVLVFDAQGRIRAIRSYKGRGD